MAATVPQAAGRGSIAARPARGTVHVIEDDAPVRASVALLLRLHDYPVQTYGSAEEFLASPALPADEPACALIDVRLPGMSGLQLQALLARDAEPLALLLMSAQGDAAVARTALLRGAVDFLEKPLGDEELLDAVASALARSREHLDRMLARALLLARLDALTPIERELFERITNGQPSREIAQALRLSPGVLEGHRQCMMRKLNAHRMSDLFRLKFAASAARTTPSPALRAGEGRGEGSN